MPVNGSGAMPPSPPLPPLLALLAEALLALAAPLPVLLGPAVVATVPSSSPHAAEPTEPRSARRSAERVAWCIQPESRHARSRVNGQACSRAPTARKRRCDQRTRTPLRELHTHAKRNPRRYDLLRQEGGGEGTAEEALALRRYDEPMSGSTSLASLKTAFDQALVLLR
jgi:hypothetical protein